MSPSPGSIQRHDLGKFLNFTVPLFSFYRKCGNNFKELYLKINELKHVKYFKQCLAEETINNYFSSLFSLEAYQVLPSPFPLLRILGKQRYTEGNRLFCNIEWAGWVPKSEKLYPNGSSTAGFLILTNIDIWGQITFCHGENGLGLAECLATSRDASHTTSPKLWQSDMCIIAKCLLEAKLLPFSSDNHRSSVCQPVTWAFSLSLEQERQCDIKHSFEGAPRCGEIDLWTRGPL